MKSSLNRVSLDELKNNQENFAENFSEGNPNLKRLLLTLWDKNIETVGCCAGHELETGYENANIGIKFDNIINYLPALINKLIQTNLDFRIGFNLGTNNGGKLTGFTIKDPKDTNELFITLTDELKKLNEESFDDKCFDEVVEIMKIIKDRNLGFYPGTDYSDIFQIHYHNLDKVFILVTNIDYILDYLDESNAELIIKDDFKIPTGSYSVSYEELKMIRKLIESNKI